jgi:hypothetical protein
LGKTITLDGEDYVSGKYIWYTIYERTPEEVANPKAYGAYDLGQSFHRNPKAAAQYADQLHKKGYYTAIQRTRDGDRGLGYTVHYFKERTY